jgi:hypothetical protein
MKQGFVVCHTVHSAGGAAVEGWSGESPAKQVSGSHDREFC